MIPDTAFRRALRWGLYPLSWIWIILGLGYYLHMGIEAGPAWMLITLPLLIVFQALELATPLKGRWGISWRSLPSDVVFVGLAAASIGMTATLLAMLSITIAGQADGPARDWPLWLQLPVLFLIFEFCNYWIHRAMHELRGSAGRVLWHIHAAHHLPQGLYVLMHAVVHPFNAMIIQGVAIIIPIWLMGYSPDAVLVFLVVNAFHGIISHFNVDMRMGWVNYLFVGPELHRYHHSAAIGEALNYGATLSVWDQLFGTFVYRPGEVPAALGTAPDAGLPSYRRVLSVLGLPFRSAG